MVQFGINTRVWTPSVSTPDLEELIPHVADLGFDHVEVHVEHPDDFDAERVAELLTVNSLDASVAIVMRHGRDLVHPDHDYRNNARSYLEGCIDVAATIGATNVVGPMYSETDRTWRLDSDQRQSVVADLATELGSLADTAADRDVKLCLEPLHRFATSVLNTTTQGNDVVGAVDHPALGLNLDTFHMHIEEKDSGDAIRMAGDDLFHLHASENDRGVPGSGQVDWDGIASALDAVDFDGPVVIESWPPNVEGLADRVNVWRPLAESPDELARDGLAFLETLLEDV